MKLMSPSHRLFPVLLVLSLVYAQEEFFGKYISSLRWCRSERQKEDIIFPPTYLENIEKSIIIFVCSWKTSENGGKKILLFSEKQYHFSLILSFSRRTSDFFLQFTPAPSYISLLFKYSLFLAIRKVKRIICAAP